MKKIFSNIDSNVQIVTLIRKDEVTSHRHNLSDEKECLQVAAKRVHSDSKFPAHHHNICDRATTKTQEAWVVVQGRIKAVFYDIDDSKILETELSSGDCAVVFNGGHGFEVVDNDTIIYEFKNGPYYGVDVDKEYINDEN